MMRTARQTIGLAASSKSVKRSFGGICGLAQVYYIMTDRE